MPQSSFIPGMPMSFAGSWAGPVKDALLNYQLYNPASPAEQQQIGSVFGSLISKGPMTFRDERGSVSVNPLYGQLDVMGKNFGVGITANRFDPSAQFKFQFGRTPGAMVEPPVMMSSFLNEGQAQPGVAPGRQELTRQLEQYTTSNPDWYRYR